jgi:hypothetical protein
MGKRHILQALIQFGEYMINLTASIRPANFRNTEGLELNVHVDTVTDIFLAAWQVASTRI